MRVRCSCIGALWNIATGITMGIINVTFVVGPPLISDISQLAVRVFVLLCLISNRMNFAFVFQLIAANYSI